MRYLLISIMLLTGLFGRVVLTPHQKKTRDLILKVAPHYTNYKSTILAMSMVESNLGLTILGDDSKSLGIMQLQIRTVRYIAKRDRRLAFLLKYSDRHLATLLLRNDRLSIIIACRLFEYYRKRYGYFGAISRYNGGSRNVAYYRKVIRWKKKFIQEKYY